MSDPFPRDIQFIDAIRHLRYWLAMRNIPDRNDIKIEIRFPNQRSQHYAAMELRRELSESMRFLTAPRVGHQVGLIYPDRMEMEGISVTLSNPDRFDLK